MPHLLPSVLTTRDLPEAELNALRIDSELFSIGDAFAPIDAIDEADLRGASLAAVLPARLIAERATAAWVLCARDRPPPIHELCADTAARYRCLGQPRLLVREVLLDDGDTTIRGGMRVTTALRTITDIVRSAIVFGEEDGSIIRRLAAIGQLDQETCVRELRGRRHLPNKIRALTRLLAALG